MNWIACYPIWISTNQAEVMKISGTFFYMFLTAKRHEILYVISHRGSEGPPDLIYENYPFLATFTFDSIWFTYLKWLSVMIWNRTVISTHLLYPKHYFVQIFKVQGHQNMYQSEDMILPIWGMFWMGVGGSWQGQLLYFWSSLDIISAA